MSRAIVKRKKRAIISSLKKSGVKTLQDVLNTTVLSDDAKIKHIRHTYTCYEKYVETFYRNQEGMALRKELNTFLDDFVKGKYTIEELEQFNHTLKMLLEVANDNYIKTQAALYNDKIKNTKELIQKIASCGKKGVEVEKLDPTVLPMYVTLSDKEKVALTKCAATVRKDASVAYREKICENYLKQAKVCWRTTYKNWAKEQPLNINRYLIEMYLENRSTSFYPADFSDLDYVIPHHVVEKAREWLIQKFDNDMAKYSNFVQYTLPAWIESNHSTHEDKLLEKLDV